MPALDGMGEMMSKFRDHVAIEIAANLGCRCLSAPLKFAHVSIDKLNNRRCFQQHPIRFQDIDAGVYAVGELLFRFREHHARLRQADGRVGAEGQVSSLAREPISVRPALLAR